MIIQLSAILGSLLQGGLQIGAQFLNRELGRDARRDQRDLIKAQARATGAGASFVQSAPTGVFSAPFVQRPPAIPVQTAGIGPGIVQGARTLLRRIGPDIAGGVAGGAAIAGAQRFFNGTAGGGGATGTFAGPAAPFAASFSERFVLDKASGCLRVKMPGEKGATFKIDKNGDFVRVKARRINPANKSAARRASRRIDATINFMSDLVRVSTKRDKGKTVPGGGGKVVTFRTKKRKKAC